MTITSFRKLQVLVLLVAFLSATIAPPSQAFDSEESVTAPTENSIVAGSSGNAADLSSPTVTSIEDAVPVSSDVSSDVSNITAMHNPQSSLVLDGMVYKNVPGYVELSNNEPSPIRTEEGVVVVDNDLAKEKKQVEAYTWKEVKSEPGKTHISMGARFPIVLVSAHSSKTCRVGDRVEARLKTDVHIAGKTVARKNDRVLGRITSAHKARRLLVAEFVPKRWMRANGAIGLTFDEIVTAKGEHLPLMAIPARMSRIVSNKAEGRILGVNQKGEVVSPLSIQLKHQALHLAIRGACSAGGVFSMGAVPVAFGVIGAINPSFAFMHPVGHNVRHRRLKGFGMGVVSGLPGGFLVADYIIRGVESNLKPGDEFLVSFQQNFTGEPATYAELYPQNNLKVKGEVVLKNKARKPAHPAP